MGLIKTFVQRPVTTAMMVLVFVVLGLVSARRMVLDLFPELDFPLVQIIAVYPGAGPEEIESQIVEKIEDEISNISDIEDIFSEIHEGFAWTIVEFNLDADVDIKALDVKDKVEQIKHELPEAAEDPIVVKFDPLSFPIVKVALMSDEMSGLELFELADKKLKDQFGQVSGVAKVEVLGGAQRQINIWAKLEKMAQYGLTVMDLLTTVGQQSLDIPAGDIKQKTREIGVRFKGEVRSVEDIANLTFNAPGRGVIRIADVARVEDGSKEIESLVRYNGESAVLLDIYKRSDGNTVAVADGTYAKMEELNQILPEGTRLFIAEDVSTFIRDAVANARSNIVLGVFLCALLLWVFLMDIRITFVAAVVIPTSIISAFLLMDFSGFSINVLTLSALGISIGTLVANAIVVLENITRYVEKGESPREAAVGGTKEIAVAVLASAGTNIVVFTPIAFMSGMVGKFFFQFGLAVVFATIFSIVASFSLTPMLSGIFIRKEKHDESNMNFLIRILRAPLLRFKQIINSAQERYSNSLKWVLSHPVFTSLATLAVFIGSFGLFKFIGAELFPATDQNIIRISAQLPKGSTEQSASQVLSEIEDVVKAKIPEMRDYTARAGGENVGFDRASVNVRLVNTDERQRSDREIMYDIQPELAKIPGAEIVTHGEGEAGSRGDIDIEVYGTDYNIMAELSQKVRNAAMEIGNFRAVFNKYRVPKDEVHFIPDAYRRADYGVPNALLGMVMRNSIEGEDGGVLRMGGEEYDIKVRLEEEARNSIQDLKTYKVPTMRGLVPLSTLGTMERTKGIASLERKNKERYIGMECFISEKSQMENVALLDKKLDEIEFPPGYRYGYGRNVQMQEETSSNIMEAFILAIILTYMLLAAILNSFVHPLTIMVTVPLGLVGVLFTLFFSGISFNIMSMMAIVMLVGIVVNNAILIIDYALQNLRSSAGDLKWCVQDAAVVKFRAILITNLAIIAGIFPQVTGGSGSEFMIPIAAATMGGVAVSTLFTLFTIPALFVLMESSVQRVRRRFRSDDIIDNKENAR
ncbi:MAG: efflux RND transporter permease subunit [Deltaproteobacteria bacterium]|nr:MAG: efflux RND transporter permease subunit [Deltaproteobacteria bacterium]